MGKWIFKYGDFELYHGIKYMLGRECRNAIIPAFWKTPNFSHSVYFTKTVTLDNDEEISILSEGSALLKIDGKTQVGSESYVIPAGKHQLCVYVGNLNSMCAIKIDGDNVYTDESWICGAYENNDEPAGTSPLLEDWNGFPGEYEFPKEKIIPVADNSSKDERIIDLGKETFVKVHMYNMSGKPINVFYGETIEETHSPRCVITEKISGQNEVYLKERAARYIRFTGDVKFDSEFFYPHLNFDKSGYFKTNGVYQKIDEISRYTLELCSRMFFLDGIKRDKWPWAGDTYLSVKSDFYSFFDTDIIKRTLLMLRGNDDAKTSVNKVLAFSFYWFLTAWEYYVYTGDTEFIRRIYRKMKSLMNLHIDNTNDEGLLPNIGSWNFIDWHDIEDGDYNSVIQMLYGRSLNIMSRFAGLLGEAGEARFYKSVYDKLYSSVNTLFWNDKLKGYVTTYKDGVASEQVRRHQNYFAILFGFADENRKNQIIQSVLFNNTIPKITTPFFKFFECETLIACGYIKEAFDEINAFWGDMTRRGVTTFWEEFDPGITGSEQYAMYGEPFDKSLCHAWGATPLYFIGKYCAGVFPIKPGYEEFLIKPIADIGDFTYRVPINNGFVTVEKNGNEYEISSNKSGGTVIIDNKETKLIENKPLKITMNTACTK